MFIFKFADIGEGLHEGVVGQIEVKVGDSVKEGDTLFTVETDKVTSEIPSPATGKVAKVLIEEGQTIHVGDPIFHIDDGSGDAPVEESKKEEVKEEKAASVVGDLKVSNEVVDFNKNSSTQNTSSKRILSTPYARKLAAKKGIDISQVTGSGISGRILAKDVESFNGSSATQQNTKVSNFKPSTVKVTSMRKAIARAMKNSWSNVAYTSLTLEVDMSTLWDQRARIKKQVMEKHGVNLTFTALIAHATALALEDFPLLNSKLSKDESELINPGTVNLGIAVDTPKGLVVPVIQNSNTKGLVGIADEIIQYATKAKKGKLTATDMSGGTFTLTNYGSAGAIHGIPVINYPEIGIIGMGTIYDKVFVKNGNFVAGKAINLTCSADHRWIDGGMIGRFLLRVKEILENPILMGGL